MIDPKAEWHNSMSEIMSRSFDLRLEGRFLVVNPDCGRNTVDGSVDEAMKHRRTNRHGRPLGWRKKRAPAPEGLTWGALLKGLRKKSGATYKDFCLTIGVDMGTLSRIERGMKEPPEKAKPAILALIREE